MDFTLKRFSFKQLAVSTLSMVLASSTAYADDYDDKSFTRIATFPVFLNSSIDNETVAEIVAVSKNGKTLIYTDGKQNAIGFVDIKNPTKPKPAGLLELGGEPTSVAVKEHYALAAVNTSVDYIDVSGDLVVIDIKTKSIIKTITLGGQPDSIAVSPDGQYAAVVLENERNEDFNDGLIPQLPAGQLVIVDMTGTPEQWSTRVVEMAGLSGMLYAEDPEPEYVDINEDNIAVVTLQENNHIVLVDLKSGDISNHFSAGTQDLEQVDVDKDNSISLESSLTSVPREPDGVNWINNSLFATADEGDLDGGSRGFTVYHKDGTVKYESAESMEHTIVRHGHYPDKRSGKKGNEPENVEFGRFKDNDYLFVGSERASVTLVYNVNDAVNPVLQQVLPTSVKPEGLLAIPRRNLFIAAGEEDARDDKIRSALTIYQYSGKPANYPTIKSADRNDGTPIPWGALSGLTADSNEEDVMYTIHDSFYDQARIFEMDLNNKPAIITNEIILKDNDGQLADVDADLVNDDGTVNLDQEGIAIRKSGGFWIASEGSGTVGDTKKPFKSLNLILGVKTDGTIDQVITLPDSVNARQVRFGFEGVTSTGTEDNETLYVAFQREWAGDEAGYSRIGRYEVNSDEWRFYYYPLETTLSAAGGWVGLSEIVAIDNEKFLVIERDNQANVDAEIKRIYKFSVRGLTPKEDSEAPDFPVVEKKLKHDLLKNLEKTKGMILEKIEGLSVTKEQSIYIVNDNDGVDDSNGETQLLKIR